MSGAARAFHPRDVPTGLLAVSRWRGGANLARTWAGIALLPWACGQVGGAFAWVVAAVVASALQNHLMVLLHHSIHVNLHPARRVNDFLARWLISGPMAQPWSYMRRAHIQHHAKLGQPGDPDRWYYDVELFGRRRPAVLLSWLGLNVCGGLLVPTIRKIVTGRRSPEDPVEGAGTGNAVDAASAVVAQAAIALAFFALSGAWWAWIVLWAIPAVTLGGGLNCFRTALEHVDAGHPPNRDWSFRSNPLELFFVAPFAMNYHWEHHLLMTVPYYRMEEFRRHLEERGAFREGVLVGSYAGRLRQVLAELRTAPGAGRLTVVRQLSAVGGTPRLAVAVGSALALLLALAAPMFFGETYVHSDLGRFGIPMRHFFAEALAAGHGFLWCPYQLTGFYLHGEGQAVLTHPLNLLQYRLLPFTAALNLEILRSYVFAGVGAALFLRRWRLPWDAAVFGGLLFAFSSFNFFSFMHLNTVGILAHVPWALLAIDVALRSDDRRHVALARLSVSLLTASQLLLAHPQFTWIAWLAEAGYALFALAEVGALRPLRRAAGRLLPVAVAALLGILSAGVQLLPQWEALAHSSRAEAAPGFANSLALEPARLATLVAPYLFADRSAEGMQIGIAPYSGIAVPVLVMWAVWRRRSLGRSFPLARAGLVLAGLGLVLAIGEVGGLYRLQELLPVVGLFRAPGRYVALTQLGLAVTAAAAFADLVRRGPGAPLSARGGLLLLLPAAAGAAASAWLVFAAGRPGATALAAPAWIALGPGLAVIAAGLVAAAARGHGLAAAALVALTAADLGAYALPLVRSPAPSDPAKWLAAIGPPPKPSGLRLNYGPQRLIMHRVRLASGYASMVPDRVLPVGTWLPEYPDPAVLRAALRVASVAVAFGEPVPDPQPRARLVSRAVASEDVLAELGRIDVATTAVTDVPVALGGGTPGSARIAADLPGDVTVETRADSPQLLVLSESFHPGWSVRVDGAACAVVRVYGDFLGCRVEAGNHRVRFRFEPASFRHGLAATGAGLLLSFGWAGWTAGYHRRRPAGEAQPS